ncbi:MAG: hypothetical protein U0W40_04105 [Acidimicrobiia bacterium]
MTAEVAFAVSDEHQARHRIDAARTPRRRGSPRWGSPASPASTLPENRRMLRVFHEAGWEVDNEHVGVVELSFPIDDDERTRGAVPARASGRARSMERLLHPQSVAVISASRAEHTRSTTCSSTSSRAGSPARSTP